MMLAEVRRLFRAHIILLALLLPWNMAMAATPEQEGRITSNCWASGPLSEDMAALAKMPQRWDCSDQAYTLDNERAVLRFDINPGETLPRYFFSRSTALDAIQLLAIDADGAARHIIAKDDQILNSRDGGYLMVALPEVTNATRQILVAIDMPSHRMTLERAYLAPTDIPRDMTYARFMLLMAGLCGMLIMPLFFNAAFYRILRERFVLWHSALTMTLLLTVMISSGLSVALIAIPAMTLSWMATMVFGLSVAAGLMFTHSFVEPDLLNPRLRRALPYAALSAVMLSIFHTLFPYVARPVQSAIYTAAFAPVIILFVWAMLEAVHRGSRAAKFQAIGYAPMLVVGIIRLVTGIVPTFESNDAMTIFYFGCAFEVLLTTMGVADRFMQLKNQRDNARSEAKLLERLTESDPLTGLLNRRAIETRFADHCASGFHTLAVIDLDHFKTINDRYGHGVGDAVLQAVAEALRPNDNVHAFRIGGEEFVLFLRGDTAVAEAEHRRRSITAIVARAVGGLESPVTASMGVAYLDYDGEGFAELYARADSQLYAAKAAGRNRTKMAGYETSPRLSSAPGQLAAA